MKPNKILYTECVHGDRSGNFDRYVTSQSTRQKFSTSIDRYDRKVETTVFYRGASIIGKQLRDSFGYRYFLRSN